MKNYISILFLGFLMTLNLSAQEYTDRFNIKDYISNEVIRVEKRNVEKIILSPYGKTLQSNQQLNRDYSFQGQESDFDLGLYFFPSRIYSPKEKRFFQPDPKSQYFSPYLFVGADPVNIVDKDGNEGKSLILYGEDHNSRDSKYITTKDFLNETTDSYQVPLSDFINRNIGDLPEWNGNIFIKSHASREIGHEITVEQAYNPDRLKTSSKQVGHYIDAKENYVAQIDAEVLGGSIRDFSEAIHVPVKNIFVGGCQGGEAANRIGMGFTKGYTVTRGRKLVTSGLKPDRYAYYAGPYTSVIYADGLPHTNLYLQSTPSTALPIIEEKMHPMGYPEKKFKGFKEKIKGKFDRELPYANNEELKNLVNNRIPEKINSHFESFHFEY